MTALAQDAAVGVLGAGTMGAGIAQVAATAGHQVYLFDAADGAAEKGYAGIAAFLTRSVEKGRLQAAEKDAILGRITVCSQLSDMASAALVIEAIVEKLAIKQQVFAELESLLSPQAILASNTSSLSITAIGAGLARPDRLVGMHFFNPAPLMKLVEVVEGLATDPAVKETIFDTATAWGKVAVYARSTPGFIANRIARPFYSNGLRLLQEGCADVATIDAVLRDAGDFRMGPFELMDLIGIDVNLMVTKSVWNAFYQDPRYTPNLLQEEMVAAGRFGRKSGHGWYPYGDDVTRPAPDDAPAGPKPKRVILSQNPALAAEIGETPDPTSVLIAMAEEAGIEIDYDDYAFDFDDLEEFSVPDEDGLTAEMNYSTLEPTIIQLDGARLQLTRGAPAYEESLGDNDSNPVVLFDLARDYRTADRIVITAPDGAPRTALLAAAGFFQALGKKVSVVEDVPGLILMRTLALLANEAADAVYQGVCSIDGADDAMINGLNYPQGPLAWAQSVGYRRIADVIEALQSHYQDPAYRMSPLLRRLRAYDGGEGAI